MIDDGINEGIYALRYFKNVSKLGRIYATAKVHKFDSLDDITVINLKFCPIISQIGTYAYNAAKVIVDYLKPLYENEYKIKDTQSYASVINDQPPSYVDKEKVSYDVDSLFANILVEEISISGVVLITIAIKHILTALCDILFTNFLTCHFLFDNLSN